LIRAVVGILKDENKVLVAERPLGKSYSGYWEFPGGKIEDDETSQDALVRELYEELGIEVLISQHYLTHHHQYPDKLVELEIYIVTKFLGNPIPKEQQQLRWVTITEIMELKLLEGNWQVLDKIKQLIES